MYNRYVPNDRGEYTCYQEPDAGPSVPREAPSCTSGQTPGFPPPSPQDHLGREASGFSEEASPSSPFHTGSRQPAGSQGGLHSLLGRLHLGDLDTGDLLLLAILFLLFRDGEDEELLIALGLLLIL